MGSAAAIRPYITEQQQGVLKNNARQLRQNMTEAEKVLWRELRKEPFTEYKFRRQHPIGAYIADFVCLQQKLMIELDGGQHAESIYDQRRDAWLTALGYRVLRLWNNDVLTNVQGVLATVIEALRASDTPHPNPLPQGERECPPQPLETTSKRE